MPQVRILIIRFSSFGDILLATPLIRQMRSKFPAAVIEFVVREKFAGILAGNPHLNKLHVLKEPADLHILKGLSDNINDAGYDYIVDIQTNFRSKYLCKRSKAKIYQWNLPRFRRWFLVKWKWNLLENYPPVPIRYLSAVEELGVKDDGAGLEYYYSDEAKLKIDVFWNEKGLKDAKVAVLAPGAKWFTKRWGVEKFIETGKKLLNSGFKSLFVLGSGEEESFCHRVCNGIGGDCYNFAGKTDFDEAASIIERCSVFIGNDSGLGHLAAAVKTPSVVIFGSTVKEFGFFPFRNRSIVLEKDIDCRPCSHIGRNSCPKKHFRCMEDIQVDECIDAVRKLVDVEDSK